MADRPPKVLICSCEDTMPLDIPAVQRGCRGAEVSTARQLCRGELDKFRAAAASGEPLIVGCTQEAPLFSETADAADVTYANIRETAGWSKDADAAGPKMAALLAAAAEPVPEVPFVGLNSEGVILIYGRDERAIEAGNLLKDHLDVTVLIKPPAEVTPPRVTDFPVVKGAIRSAKGYLGAFELVVDGYAQPAPSSRGMMSFAAPRDGAVSRCDLVLDLCGAALFTASDLRDGYLRANPDDPAAVLKAVLRARDLVGSFDKPRYVAFTEDLCAHSRSRIIGCTRCLDLCPTGAIAPAGDHVAIDAYICAGCGQCAAVCPTGAAGYALPPADTFMRKLRGLLGTYRDAGGRQPPVVLVHDNAHGAPLIDALARLGDGLPANVLPVAVNEVTQVGLESIAAAFAYGAAAMRLLLRAKPRHDVTGLRGTIALAEPILAGLGFGDARVATIETDDPDALAEALRAIPQGEGAPRPASFLPVGGKRDVMRLALRELQRAAPAAVDVIALPAGAPFGRVGLNAEGCTLCLACVSACPTGALSDNPERPMLRFAEDACVQCGLCKATCPEKVITLRPQLDFRAATATARVLKEEEPFHCIRCNKPFGVKSTIERVAAKLEGKHWMFQNSAQRLDVIKMCEDCRVAALTEQEFDPYRGPARPKARTTEDYLREREQEGRTDKPET
jgi:ferredoxin